MELIRISDEKIKISLSKAELDAYDLSISDINCKKAQAHPAFRELFVEAKEQTGFDVDGKKVFVQIFRAKNGGCEIFVSKVTTKSKNAPRKAQKYIEAHCFDNLDALIYTCRALAGLGYSEKSSAYFGEDEYYLWLDTKNELALAYPCEYDGVLVGLSTIYVSEHFSVIRENDAVDILSKL